MIDPRSAAFGRRADAYGRVRPAYPPAALDLVCESLGLDPPATVVDLAAGTGKLTAALAERFEHVVAVEPSAPMLEALSAALPRVEAVAGSAEAIPLADASAAAVFVAEAFHWFDPLPALTEIARVLAPGGGLVMLWNRERWDGSAYPWLRGVGELLAPLIEDAGSYPGGRGEWPAEFERSDDLEAPRRAEVAHVHQVDPEGFVELISTWSFVANLDPAERDRVLGRVGELIGGAPEIALDYTTELIWARSRSKPG